MRSVFKYTLPINYCSTVEAPKGTEWLHADFQHGQLVIWGLVNTEEQSKVSHLFRLTGTGQVIDENNVRFIAQVKLEALLFHLFEVL